MHIIHITYNQITYDNTVLVVSSAIDKTKMDYAYICEQTRIP